MAGFVHYSRYLCTSALFLPLREEGTKCLHLGGGPGRRLSRAANAVASLKKRNDILRRYLRLQHMRRRQHQPTLQTIQRIDQFAHCAAHVIRSAKREHRLGTDASVEGEMLSAFAAPYLFSWIRSNGLGHPTSS